MWGTKGYSLWLVPEGDIYFHYRNIIEHFAAELGTPSFDPHITLLGGLEGSREDIIAATERLAATFAPYSIELGNIGYENHPLRALYGAVIPTEEVLGAYGAACKLFGKDSRTPYFPHLSFIYGDIDEATKIKLISRIPATKNKSTIRHLSLYAVDGDVSNWHCVASVPFGREAKA